MRLIIASLSFFITLQAISDTSIETYEVIMPENIQQILELPGRLISKNIETFPDLEALYGEAYQKQLYKYAVMKISNEETDKIFETLISQEIDRESRGPIATMRYIFFNAVGSIIHNIFFNDMPSIYEEYPDVLTKSKQEQTDVVYAWYRKNNQVFLSISALECFIKNKVRFSDKPEDRFGRIIINDEEIYTGFNASLEAINYEVLLPEHLREIFEFPGRLIDNNPETFPDLLIMNDGKQSALYSELQKIILPTENTILSSIENLQKKLGQNGVSRDCHFLLFFLRQAKCFTVDIFNKELQKILIEHPDLGEYPKSEQAQIVHDFCKGKSIVMDIKLMDNFIKEHVRFTDEPEDRFGRLIINGEEVHRGTPQEVE